MGRATDLNECNRLDDYASGSTGVHKCVPNPPTQGEDRSKKILGLVSLLSSDQSVAGADEQLSAKIAWALEREILASDPSDVGSMFLHEPSFYRVIDLLSRCNRRDALWCIASSLHLDRMDVDRKSHLFRMALNLDISGAHKWVGSNAKILRERILTAASVLPETGNFKKYDLSIYRNLKRRELQALCTGSTPLGLSAAIRTVRQSQDTSEDSLDLSAAAATCHYLPLLHPWQRVFQSLAFQAPEFLLRMTQDFSGEQIEESYDALQKLVPVCLVITKIGYPMGGGESFMHQVCRILSELGYRCIWVSFSTKDEPHAIERTAFTPYFDEVHITRPLSNSTLDDLIVRFRPDFLHSQGAVNPLVEVAAARHRIPALIGYHFWGGLIDLAKESFNRKIMQNADNHRVVDDVLRHRPTFVRKYVASEFMLDVYKQVGGADSLDVYHPVSDPAQYQLDETKLGEKVLQINIAKGKGGDIFRCCAAALGSEIPFYAVRTEPTSEDLDKEICDELQKHPGSQYAGYGPITSHFAQARMVLVPTLVDETFCRIAFEAAANGIPVLSTKNGFLPYLFGDTGIYLSEDANEWINKIRSLYHDVRLLKELGAAQRDHVLRTYGLYPRSTVCSAISLTEKSPRRNFGIFVPWSEQGLGEQARTYARCIRGLGLRAHVFSYQAYSAKDRAVARQANPEDWAEGVHADTVHYSLNDRERVTLYELGQFCIINDVGALIYPEICFAANWRKITNLRVPNLRLFAVPNSETVRSSEVLFHNRLDLTWFNTRQCMRVLQAEGVNNGVFIGHGYGRKLSDAAVSAKIKRSTERAHLVLCHFGGHNPISRKQTGAVIQALNKVVNRRSDILLKIYVMDGFSRDILKETHPQIEINFVTLRHEDILKIYSESDVSIQVSSHEGLGLGFYESISTATPVISIDIPPHNEVVQRGISGWLLPPRPIPLKDNNEALVGGGLIDPDELAALCMRLRKRDIAELTASTAKLFNERFTEGGFSIKLARAM